MYPGANTMLTQADLIARAGTPDTTPWDWLGGLHAARIARSSAFIARRLLAIPSQPWLLTLMGAFHEVQLTGWAWKPALLEALRETDTDDLFVLNVVVPEIEAWHLFSQRRLDDGLTKGLALHREQQGEVPALHLAAMAAAAHDAGVSTAIDDPLLLPNLVRTTPPKRVVCCPLCAVEMLRPGETCDVCGTDTAADAWLPLAFVESLRWSQMCPQCRGPRHELAVLCPRCGHRHGATEAPGVTEVSDPFAPSAPTPVVVQVPEPPPPAPDDSEPTASEPTASEPDPSGPTSLEAFKLKLVARLEALEKLGFDRLRKLASTWMDVANLRAQRGATSAELLAAVRASAQAYRATLTAKDGDTVELRHGLVSVQGNLHPDYRSPEQWFFVWSVARVLGPTFAAPLAALRWKVVALKPADKFWKKLLAFAATGKRRHLERAHALLPRAKHSDRVAIDSFSSIIEAWLALEAGGPVDLTPAATAYRCMWGSRDPRRQICFHLLAVREEALRRGIEVNDDPLTPDLHVVM